MKAGLLSAPNQLALTSVPDPVLSEGDMLIEVKAATICGTDIRILRGVKTIGVRYPSILGHEFSGEIADNGGHSQFSCGDAVAICPFISCLSCEACKRGHENLCRNLKAIGYEIDGAFATHIRIPAMAVRSGNVLRLPANLGFEQAALVEPLACVLNGQEKIGVGLGDTVVILGAGPIGLLHVKLARLAGARTIIVSQTSPARRAIALEMGADVAVDPASEDLQAIVRDRTGGSGADKLIVTIGQSRLANDALSLVRPGGSVNLFGGFPKGELATMDVNLIHYNELVVTGSFGLTRRQFERSLDMIASGRIEVASMLTDRFALDDIAEAFAKAESGSAIKVAIVSP